MAAVKSKPKIAVVQFPGMNCEYETARALEAAGLMATVVRWNAPASAFRDIRGYVLPGGFSYQDRVRGGAIAAREPIMERLTQAADAGVPVLGICNGAQVLVEAGLVPGADDHGMAMALARNHMPDRSGYYTRWVHVAVTDEPCVFTTGLEPGSILPMPMAHGEGRFTTGDAERAADLDAGRGVALRYVRSDGSPAERFPENPNGSQGAAAGVVGGSPNVLAFMPHPERAAWIWQVPSALPGPWGTQRRAWQRVDAPGSSAMAMAGPGRALFDGLARHLEEAS